MTRSSGAVDRAARAPPDRGRPFSFRSPPVGSHRRSPRTRCRARSRRRRELDHPRPPQGRRKILAMASEGKTKSAASVRLGGRRDPWGRSRGDQRSGRDEIERRSSDQSAVAIAPPRAGGGGLSFRRSGRATLRFWTLEGRSEPKILSRRRARRRGRPWRRSDLRPACSRLD